MVDELTQESFQTGKMIVSVSVDIIQAIADACRKSEENKALSMEEKDNILARVVDFVKDNYKETHGSLKSFNKDGKDVGHMDVTDERTAEIIKDVCKKSHIPVDMQETPHADGTSSYVAFCEVKNIDQLAGILKMASEKVLEEQKAMTKEIVLLDENNKEIASQGFVEESSIKYEELEQKGEKAVAFEIRNQDKDVLDKGEIVPGEDLKEKIKEKAEKLNPKHQKSLKEKLKTKKELSEKIDKNRQRERVKQKSKDKNLKR